jgi:hypothetical protein
MTFCVSSSVIAPAHMVEAVGDAPPRYLLRDRDSIYDARFVLDSVVSGCDAFSRRRERGCPK